MRTMNVENIIQSGTASYNVLGCSRIVKFVLHIKKIVRIIKDYAIVTKEMM